MRQCARPAVAGRRNRDQSDRLWSRTLTGILVSLHIQQISTIIVLGKQQLRTGSNPTCLHLVGHSAKFQMCLVWAAATLSRRIIADTNKFVCTNHIASLFNAKQRDV